MAVRADPANHRVAVDAILDMATALDIRDAALQMSGDISIDVHDVYEVHDAALFYLVTTLRLAERHFAIEGLCWPHADLLAYLCERLPRATPVRDVGSAASDGE